MLVVWFMSMIFEIFLWILNNERNSARMTFCDACKSSDVERISGQVLCALCGKVLEEGDNIINEVQFLENAQGGSSVSGRLVGADGRFNFGGNLHLGFGRESRQVTLQKAKVRLQGIASQLRIEELYVSKALNFFRMALSKGLTKGRKADYIAAACLYTACRTADKPLPYMLLDFSDALRADVYTLGHVYLRLCKELCILQPTMQVHCPDPAIFIERYADKLEFGDKMMEVAKTATRLVSRMKRDWLVEGRRPSGICGAALLVAARIFDFNRTIKDIMKVVRIGEGTIKKRLTEFEQTPSSQLTVDEFLYQKIDLTEEMDPPSFIEGKRKAKLAELEEKGELPHLMEEVEKLQAELEAAIVETMHKKHKRYRKFMTGGDDASLCSTAPSLTDLDEELAQYGSLLDDGVLSSILEEEHSGESKKALTKKEKFDCGNRKKEDKDGGEEERDSEVEAMVERELNGMLHLSLPLGPRPTAASLGIKESIEECLNIKDSAEAEGKDETTGELDLTGINDEELDMLILSEDEVKIKTTIWMRENAEFLKEMKEKEERKAKELLENPQPKKKRKMKKRAVKTEARNAREAIEKMLMEKKLSNKIDYEVVKSLNIMGPLPQPPKIEGSSTKMEDLLGSKRSSTEPDDVSSAKKMKTEDKGAQKLAPIIIPEEAAEEDYDEEEEDYEEEEPIHNVEDFVDDTYDDYDGYGSD